jgi:hypothetical protein
MSSPDPTDYPDLADRARQAYDTDMAQAEREADELHRQARDDRAAVWFVLFLCALFALGMVWNSARADQAVRAVLSSQGSGK